MSEHAKLPWNADGRNVGDGNGHSVCRADLPPVLSMDDSERFSAARANAAFIVRACNSLEPLIEALSSAKGHLLNAKIDLETGAKKATAIATIEGGIRIIDAALAAAKGEQP